MSVLLEDQADFVLLYVIPDTPRERVLLIREPVVLVMSDQHSYDIEGIIIYEKRTIF
jgi:hypothetical protein